MEGNKGKKEGKDGRRKEVKERTKAGRRREDGRK